MRGLSEEQMEITAMKIALKEIHKIICKCGKVAPFTSTVQEANDIYAWSCYGLNIGEGKGEE